MSFPILLQGKGKTVDTTALIDSGATGNFMDVHLLSLDNFTLICLPEPIIAYNVDGTKNLKGTIRWKAKTILILENHSDPIELMILRLSKPRVILGIPWLKKCNPKINWDCLSMTLPSSPQSHIPYHAHYLGLDADHELSQLFSSSSPAKDDWSLREYRLLAGGSVEQINKVTISTQLAQAEKPRKSQSHAFALISPMSSQKRPITFSLLIDPLITLLSSKIPLSQRLRKSILLTPPNRKLAKLSSMNILRLDI